MRPRLVLVAAAFALALAGTSVWIAARDPEPVILCCSVEGGPCQKVGTFSECGPGKLAGECSCPEKIDGGYRCPSPCPGAD
jgi:hypothetical protein